MNQPIRAVVSQYFAVPAERVYDAWLDPNCIGRWMFGPDVRDEQMVRFNSDPCIGGRFSFAVDRQGMEIEHVGKYLELDQPQLLVFTWSTGGSLPDASRVIVEILPLDDGCELTLTQVMGAAWAGSTEEAAHSWRKRLVALDEIFVESSNPAHHPRG